MVDFSPGIDFWRYVIFFVVTRIECVDCLTDLSPVHTGVEFKVNFDANAASKLASKWNSTSSTATKSQLQLFVDFDFNASVDESLEFKFLSV